MERQKRLHFPCDKASVARNDFVHVPDCWRSWDLGGHDLVSAIPDSPKHAHLCIGFGRCSLGDLIEVLHQLVADRR